MSLVLTRVANKDPSYRIPTPSNQLYSQDVVVQGVCQVVIRAVIMQSSSIAGDAAMDLPGDGKNRTESTQKRDENDGTLDKTAFEQLPLSFGGSKKVNAPRALSKNAMAEGIAEMMKEIEAAERRRAEGEARQGEAMRNQEEDEDRQQTSGEEPLPSEASVQPSSSSSSHQVSSLRPAPAKRKEETQLEEEETPAATARRYRIPMSHEVILRGHYKQITCLAMDPSGARVGVGGTDNKLLLYDFGGMDRSHKPFREFVPEDGNPVVGVGWSPTGDRLVVATGSSQAKVFDRDGIRLLTCIKGDPYITDLVHTKGHTMSLSAAAWHPREKETIMTASWDGTLRLWDLQGPQSFDQLLNKRVIKARSARSTRVAVTCGVFSPVADYVAAGCQDGSVQLFSLRKTSWIKPDVLMRPAHGPDQHVTAVAFAPDGKTLASRGTDDMVRLWDIRKPQAPLKTLEGVATFYDSANLAFSPDGRVLCCGTNVPPKQEGATGTLKYFQVQGPSLEAVLTVGVAPGASVTNLTWHPRLKQVVCGTSSGATKVLYDPSFSVKGALMSSQRVKRPSDPMDAAPVGGVVGRIINPSALPMFRDDEETGKKKRARLDRADPIKSKRPDLPVNGPGAQGRVSGMTNFTQYVMQTKQKNTMMEEDPREAILKYAEKAKEGTQLVGRAYAKTAPKTPFLEKTLEQEVEDMKEMEAEILKK
ncbi:wd repeat-containing protein 70 [Nannochloropsis gaditana]|uniref:Wd repeat-containing protein 70 n=1 Tax=Nannochloropsis gaditana TaxID=72520 RepID=W7U0F2_9STRA|nr:wd repeat-containing protein 70 [Nannochloropsis gaditana]